MDDHWLLPDASDVTVDLSRLEGEPRSGDTRYTVALDGSLRSEWVDVWRELLSASAVLRRFEIDAFRAVVHFTCRNVDGTAMVFDALERLEATVKRVNEIVAVRRAAAPRVIAAPTALRAR
ncbi:MAG TPA: hypothetical protein VKG23_03285 [Thermoanaerobaculia bacterium]|jgi:hypothetical protein|nr:hypothetical protein [Thermoanaerobaculia bacterium]